MSNQDKDFYKFLCYGGLIWGFALALLLPDRNILLMLMTGFFLHCAVTYSVAFGRRIS